MGLSDQELFESKLSNLVTEALDKGITKASIEKALMQEISDLNAYYYR